MGRFSKWLSNRILPGKKLSKAQKQGVCLLFEVDKETWTIPVMTKHYDTTEKEIRKTLLEKGLIYSGEYL